MRCCHRILARRYQCIVSVTGRERSVPTDVEEIDAPFFYAGWEAGVATGDASARRSQSADHGIGVENVDAGGSRVVAARLTMGHRLWDAIMHNRIGNVISPAFAKDVSRARWGPKTGVQVLGALRAMAVSVDGPGAHLTDAGRRLAKAACRIAEPGAILALRP